jgi:hypothetical protein
VEVGDILEPSEIASASSGRGVAEEEFLILTGGFFPQRFLFLARFSSYPFA